IAWIGPRYRGHMGRGRSAQFEMIGSPVGVDDEIGGDTGPGRLEKNMNAALVACSTYRIADNPACCVARRDRSGAGQGLALLQDDIGDPAGRRIDLEQGAIGPDILLDCIAEIRALWLDPRRVIGLFKGLRRSGGRILRRDRRALNCGAQCALSRRAGGEQEHDAPGQADRLVHWLSSFDQLRASMKMPSGLLRSPSGVRGVCTLTLRIAEQRDGAVRVPSRERRTHQATRKLAPEARITLETSMATCSLPTSAKGSLRRA